GTERGSAAHLALYGRLPCQLRWSLCARCNLGTHHLLYSLLDTNHNAHAHWSGCGPVVGNSFDYRADDYCDSDLCLDRGPHLSSGYPAIRAEAKFGHADEIGQDEIRHSCFQSKQVEMVS